MSIVWWEDFESLSTETLSWRLDQVGIGVSVVSGVSGLNGNCLRLPISQSAGDFGITLPDNYSSGLFSTAMFIPSASFTATPIIGFNSGATNTITIRLNANGSITALRNTTALDNDSDPGVIPANKRFRVEVGFVVSDTVGEVIVKIDSGDGPQTVLNITDKDTNNLVSTINRIFVNIGTVSHYLYYDDMWFDTDKTAFRNDMTFKTLSITSDVSGYSTPSAGSDRYATIDELPASELDYNTFEVTGEDIFDFENLSTNPSSISGVGVYYIANKPDAGTMSFRSRILSNTDYADGNNTGLNVSILAYSDFYPLDPQGNTSWTKSRVDSAKIVVERIS